jgi:hypothetical protein
MNDENPHLAGRYIPPIERVGRGTAAEDPDHVDFPPTDRDLFKCYARAWTKPLRSIHFFTQDGKCRTFEYADLRSRCSDDEDFEPTRFKLAFFGIEPVEVVVDGRDLWPLYDYIHQHRMPWVMVAARAFGENGGTLVTHFEFVRLHATG